MIVDVQIHTWLKKDDQIYPWAEGHPNSFFETQVKPHAIETVVADMDEAGVDAGLLVVPSLYGWDNRYALHSARKYPTRFGVIARIDWRAPNPKSRLAALMTDKTIKGIRITERHKVAAWAPDGEIEPMLAAAEELGVPVCGSPGVHGLPMWHKTASAHPGLKLVLDHLGMEAPPTTVPAPPPDPFKTLPDLLALAKHKNIFVKMSASPALSHERFPFRDIWPSLKQIIGAFGAERIMWGSDYNRTKTLYSYKESAGYLEEMDGLSRAAKDMIYGGTLSRVFAWQPREAGSNERAIPATTETRG